MSLIPLDEPRGDGYSPPREGAPNRSFVGRLWGRLSAAVAALRTLVHAPSDDESDARALSSSADGERATVAAVTSGDPGPGELLSTETDDQLTLALADNPDATITSDTWVPVER